MSKDFDLDSLFQQKLENFNLSEQQAFFLSVCSQHDLDLISGKESMSSIEFSRLIYLLTSLSFFDYIYKLLDQFIDFSNDYLNPDFDRSKLALFDQWGEEFLNQLPTDEIRNLLKPYFFQF